VYEATHIITGDVVAIKVFSDCRAETVHAACAEFVCAMRSAGPSALQYHELAFLNGKPALVMELGEQCLDKWIKGRHFAPSVGCASRARSKASAGRRSSSARASDENDGDDNDDNGSWGSQSTTTASPVQSWGESRAGSIDAPAESAQSEWQLGPQASPTQLDIMNIMLGVLEGLTVMHAAGLAHLDLKPGNVIMTDMSTAKLADFGAACAIDLRTGKLAIGLSTTRGVAVDSLVESMEHKLGVNLNELASSLVPGNAASAALASAAIGAVQAEMLPVKSCPGDLEEVTEDEVRRTLSVESGVPLPPRVSLLPRAPQRPPAASCARQAATSVRAAGGSVRFNTMAQQSRSARDSAGGATAMRPAAASVTGAYGRQPAYSLRDVPMVRLLALCSSASVWANVATHNFADARAGKGVT
jgi:Protein kinase domain